MMDIDAEANDLLKTILARLQAILEDRLVGLYLYGSLVTGDFDPVSSDVDLLAVTEGDINEQAFKALQTMHHDLVRADSNWDNRIEIAYVSRQALKTFKTQPYKIGIISPGEPFHIVESEAGWLMNWYVIREKGLPLFGLDVKTIIDPISNEEYVQAVRGSIANWRSYDLYSDTVSHRSAQAYAILTMCRGLYTHQTGDLLSKRQAAAWAQQELPEWASLIQNALVWRKNWRDERVDHAATLDETRRFVSYMIDRILL